jgi:hypothetical protein
MPKAYTVTKNHGRTGSETAYSGTVAELVEIFRYTLESGHGYNHRINVNPKTAKALVTALNKSVEETQGSCFSQDSYELTV